MKRSIVWWLLGAGFIFFTALPVLKAGSESLLHWGHRTPHVTPKPPALQPAAHDARSGGENSTPPAAAAADALFTWRDARQKAACAAYVDGLRTRFLKARRHSIKGDPCDTADSAAAFLEVLEKCERECPQGYTRHIGYSDRLLRNLQYLEKFGRDRCTARPSATAAPGPAAGS